MSKKYLIFILFIVVIFLVRTNFLNQDRKIKLKDKFLVPTDIKKRKEVKIPPSKIVHTSISDVKEKDNQKRFSHDFKNKPLSSTISGPKPLDIKKIPYSDDEAKEEVFYQEGEKYFVSISTINGYLVKDFWQEGSQWPIYKKIFYPHGKLKIEYAQYGETEGKEQAFMEGSVTIPDSTFKEYYESGQLMIEGNVVGGHVVNKKEYHQNGNLKSEIHYSKTIHFFIPGATAAHFVVEGKKVGVESFYDDEGKLLKQHYWEDYDYWRKSGQPVVIYDYEKGIDLRDDYE